MGCWDSGGFFYCIKGVFDLFEFFYEFFHFAAQQMFEKELGVKFFYEFFFDGQAFMKSLEHWVF